MSFISFFFRGKVLTGTFALTTRFHGPPKARIRSA
ncbi:hypothetical protein ABIA48_000074 [Pseudomonas sp. S30_BP2TU TE3576]